MFKKCSNRVFNGVYTDMCSQAADDQRSSTEACAHLLFFGVVAINLLLYYARACVCARRVRTPQMGSFFSPTLVGLFCVLVPPWCLFTQRILNTKKRGHHHHKNTFLIKHTIYTALLSSSSSVRFWGYRGTTLEEIYNNNSDNEW